MATKWKVMTQKKCRTNGKYRFFPFNKQQTEENHQILFPFFFFHCRPCLMGLFLLLFDGTTILHLSPSSVWRQTQNYYYIILFRTSEFKWKIFYLPNIFIELWLHKVPSNAVAVKNFNGLFFPANHHLHSLKTINGIFILTINEPCSVAASTLLRCLHACFH